MDKCSHTCPPVLRRITLERSLFGILQTDIEIKTWLKKIPDVDQVRPSRCPRCKTASRCPGRNLSIHGHGVVSRDIWGALTSDDSATIIEVKIRRYRCLQCRHILRVGPKAILPYRRYHAAAIAAAFALWAIFGWDIGSLRQRVSPWQHVAEDTHNRWVSLFRWTQLAANGDIWPLRQKLSPHLSRPDIAAYIVRSLVARLTVSTLGGFSLEKVYIAALKYTQ